MSSAALPPGNMLLSALPLGEMLWSLLVLTRVCRVIGQSLHEAGGRIEGVFFAEQGFASMVAGADGGGDGVEAGLKYRWGAASDCRG